jgi:perosamine synthetase
MEIPINRPTLKRKHMNSVLSCMVSDSIGSGSLSGECAAAFADYLGATGGLCLASMNQVIHLALDALNLEPGGAVLLSALAPAHYHRILTEHGLIPLIADVDPNSALMLPSTVESMMSRSPQAMIVTHPFGMLAPAGFYENLDIPIIDDLSQALGGGSREGNFRGGGPGSLCILSLGEEGIVTAGGGGVLVARDKKLLAAVKAGLEVFQPQALLADLNAALGLAQLRDIEHFLAARRDIAAHFTRALSATRHSTLVQPDEQENVLSAFPVRVADSMKTIRQYAAKQNITTRPAFSDRIIALEELQAGEEREGIITACPNAADLLRRCVLFPLYPTLGKKNLQLITRVLATLP